METAESIFEDSTNSAESLKHIYQRDGYVFIPRLLDPIQVEYYLTKVKSISKLNDADFEIKKARRGGFAKADEITANPDFWDLIFNPKLLDGIRAVLGDDAKYTQHSDIHVHHGTVGWHRDSKDRSFGVGPDWDERNAPYGVARVAIYLQSYSESGFSLGLVPGSHRSESLLTKCELKFHSLLTKVLNRRDLLPPLLSAKTIWIKVEPGDCLIFDQRVLHTGSFIHGPKYALFLSYGMNNLHSVNHRKYYLFERKDLCYSDYPAQLKARLKACGLNLEI